MGGCFSSGGMSGPEKKLVSIIQGSKSMNKRYKKGVQVESAYDIIMTGEDCILEKSKTGNTYKAIKKSDQNSFAVKILPVPKSIGNQSGLAELQALISEIGFMCKLDHRNIASIVEFYIEGGMVYSIMELMTGGTVMDTVILKKSFSERDAQQVFQQMLEGLQYLHSLGVAHRNLKLENLVLVRKGDLTHLKIIDIGHAQVGAVSNQADIRINPLYGSPEMVKAYLKRGPVPKPGAGPDMWSAGVILFFILGGYPPFYADQDSKILNSIIENDWDFDKPVWGNISSEAKDLIKSLMKFDARDRLLSKQALNHKWLSMEVAAEDLGDRRVEHRKYIKSKFKKAIYILLAIDRMQQVVEDIKSGKSKRGTVFKASSKKQLITKNEEADEGSKDGEEFLDANEIEVNLE